jgi:hypothetical protein
MRSRSVPEVIESNSLKSFYFGCIWSVGSARPTICKVKKAKIVYKIDDYFTDAADIFNCTTKNEELIGGEGYKIHGQWTTGIGKY